MESLDPRLMVGGPGQAGTVELYLGGGGQDIVTQDLQSLPLHCGPDSRAVLLLDQVILYRK